MRNYQAEAITVLTLSCADLLLSLEIFRLSQEDFQSRPRTVSSMIQKIQEDNMQELLGVLMDEDKSENFSVRWLDVLKRSCTRFRRQKKTLVEIQPIMSTA